MSDDKMIRERLIVWGAEKLSDAELLSVIIQEGDKSKTALEIAESLLEDHGKSLYSLYASPLKKIRSSEGVGLKTAALICAALELGHRASRAEAMTHTKITNNEDVERIFKPLLSPLAHEEFWVVYLSSANTILNTAKVSSGGSTATVVDNKLVLKKAIDLLACSLILVHNHPSGVALPSREDNELTQSIMKAAELFDIRVLDHIIITCGPCYSFRKEGFII